jgi:hypothetical protein
MACKQTPYPYNLTALRQLKVPYSKCSLARRSVRLKDRLETGAWEWRSCKAHGWTP